MTEHLLRQGTVTVHVDIDQQGADVIDVTLDGLTDLVALGATAVAQRDLLARVTVEGEPT